MAYLPGQMLSAGSGGVTTCDEHPDRLSVRTLVGETDSFGSEFFGLCQECYDNELIRRQIPKTETELCDWCHREEVCHPTRDIGEGASGPVYWVCQSCGKIQNQRINEE